MIFSSFLASMWGSSNLVISHLMYTDDNIILGEPSIANIWAIKAVLS